MESQKEFHEDYEILLVKLASVVAKGLMIRLERMNACNVNLLPGDTSVILKKEEMDAASFSEMWKDGQLTDFLNCDSITVSLPLMNMLTDYKSVVEKLEQKIIVVEPPNDGDGKAVQVYLVKESCLLQIKKQEDFVESAVVPPDSKCQDVMATVAKLTDCYAAVDNYLCKIELAREWNSFQTLLAKKARDEAEMDKDDEEVVGDDEESQRDQEPEEQTKEDK